MCQYKSVDGFATDWHLVHLGSRAVGGAALVMTEATAVEPQGRISPDDLGLWKDEHIEFLARVTAFITECGAIPGVQLAHAGRKASTVNPWKTKASPTRGAVSNDEGGWDVVGPTSTPFSDSSKLPHALSVTEIHGIQRSFAAATARARAAGFKWVEFHAAHGYLAHSFYSPLSNTRTDEYGGSFENRIRFVLETVDAMKSEWSDELPFAVRLSASDWVDGGWSIEDSVELSKILKEKQVDVIDVSSGFVAPGAKYPMGPGWQVGLSEQIKRESNMLTAAVGLITEPAQANFIIENGQADLVLLARESIRSPYWPFEASKELGIHSETIPFNYTYYL